MRSVEPRSVTVRTGDQRLHLRIVGNAGPLVLLCHGFPESWYAWRHQLAPLAEAGYQAVAVDMLGYGRSSKPADPSAYAVTELVRGLVDAVAALGETSAVIVGHDLGAPVAWTAAWTRPDVFRAVAGLSVPFAGRGLAALPGSPFGELRPSEVHARIAGPDSVFYQDHLARADGAALEEIEPDVRDWLLRGLYTLSADRPLPPELAGAPLTALPDDVLVGVLRQAMCVPKGQTFVDLLERPEVRPSWLTERDLEVITAEFEAGGLAGPLRHYANGDADWERLSAFEGRTVTVPALYLGADRDIVTIWSREARERATEHLTDLRGSVILADCGHWLMQERPQAVTDTLLGFLRSL